MLGVEPRLLGQAAVMGGHLVVAESLAEVPCDALRHPPCVHEDERRSVRADQLGQTIVVLLPHFVRHHGAERRPGYFQLEVDGPPMAFVDDDSAAAGGIDAHQEAGHGFQGALRCRQADALKRPLGNLLQPLEGQRQVRATARPDHGVDLVDDDGAGGAEQTATPLGREQQIQRLRSGDQDVRRPLEDGSPFGLRGVAGTDGSGDARRLGALGFCKLTNAAPRFRKILVNVGAERFQGRDVHDADFVWQRRGRAFTDEVVDGDQKSRKRLSRAGRRRDERMPAVANGVPSKALRARRLAKRSTEPFRNERMKTRQGHRGAPDVRRRYRSYQPRSSAARWIK